MKIRQLHLQRFGHFEDISVEFGPGLTVLHGGNEAGKSTLLDGLGGFLWGVAARNRRAFAHTAGQALLTGTVESGGVAVAMTRRLKKLTCEGAEVPAPWGGGARDAEQQWRTTFGLDRAALRAGGREVLAGKGDLADLIALAESGQRIGAVLETLAARADALYVERKGAGCEIREVAKQITELGERIAATMASAEDVAEVQQRIADLTERRGESERWLAAARRQLHELRELQRCLEPAAQLRQAEGDVTGIAAEGPVLDAAATADLATALQDRRSASARISEVSEQLARARARVERNTPDAAVLAAADRIGRLREQIEARQADRAALDSTAAAEHLVAAVEHILLRLGRSPGGDPVAAAEAALLGEPARAQLSAAASALGDRRRDIARLQAELDELQPQDSAEDADAGADEGERLVLEARRQRDALWRAVRGPWVSGDLPQEDARGRMAAELDAAIADADAVAESRSQSLQSLGERRGQQAERGKLLARARAELARAAAELDAAEARWRSLAAAHGLPADLDPAGWTVQDALLGDLADGIGQVRSDTARRAQARDRFAQFEREVGALADLLPEGCADPVAAVASLGSMLDRARAAQQTAQELAAQIEELGDESAAAQRQHRDAEAAVARLTQGLDEQAEVIVSRSERLHAAEGAVAEALSRLISAKDPGTEVAAVRSALLTVDAVAIAAELHRLDGEVEDRSGEQHRLHEEIGRATERLGRLQSSEPVHALQAQQVERGARLRDLVEEYRGLKVQIALLRSYKQVLADRSDSSLLDHAGRLLAALTGGRFTGFVIVEDSGGRRIDVLQRDADRPGETQPLALAALSEGTADQVFLALRLAGISVRQAQRSAAGLARVPVVLDDVLMSSDDARSATAVGVLAEFAEQMQIILLTHHRSVADAAVGLEAATVVELPAVSSYAPAVPAQA